MDLHAYGSTAHIMFSRPDKLHALNAAQWGELATRVNEAGADPHVRAVILNGSVRAFCAGNDIDEFRRLETTAQARDYFLGLVLPAMEAIVSCPVPVISAVRGPALGGGCEIVLISDLAVAGTSATFRLPEACIGVWPTVFAAVAPYTLAHKAVNHLALTTGELDSATALRHGLVHDRVDDDQVDATAAQLAATIAGGSRDTIARTKQFTTARLRTEAMAAVRSALTELCDETLFNRDAAEGIRAFRAKQTPAFAVPA